MAMFRLYAGLEEGWGRAVKDILRKQFPDAKAEINKGISDLALGQKLLAIAMKQTQYNETKAQEAIQDQIMYWATGTSEHSGKSTDERSYQEYLKAHPEDQDLIDEHVKYQRDVEKAKDEKKPPPKEPSRPLPKELRGVKKPKEKDPKGSFDFTKGSKNWEEALDNMFSNLRHRSMSFSQGYTKEEKKERSIDQAYGQRGEDGGAPEGGEGRMPTPEDTGIGKALDDKASIKQFMDVIDENLPALRAFLSDDERKLFDLIFEEDVGSFGSDVKENMKQATALKDKYPDLYQKNQKRWSGFVGDLRKKVLEKIWEFVDDHMDPEQRGVLRETFFADVDPTTVRKREKEKSGDKLDYQRGLDERKLAKLKWMEQNGTLDDKGKATMESLKENMGKRYKGDLDLDAIPAVENPKAEGWTLHSKRAASGSGFSLEAVSSRVARAFSRTGT